MKRKYSRSPFAKAAVFVAATALVVAGSVGTASADWTIATFDTDLASNGGANGNEFRVGDDPQPSQLVWTNIDASGGAGGSLYVIIDWAGGGGWKDTKVQTDMDPWPGYDLRQYQYIEFDVKILQDMSEPDANGNYGLVQVVGQGWDGAGDNSGVPWTGLDNVTLIDTNGWQHIKVSTLGFPHYLNRLTLNFNNTDNVADATQIHYLIDNVVLTSPPLDPPTLGAILPPPGGGLNLTPTAASQWQRVMVYPNPNDTNNTTGLMNDFGWSGKATPSNPVSYSFTIADFPNINDYAANVFLIPNAHMQWGQGDTAGDWNSTNTTIFNITADTNNPPTAWNVNFSCKTNLGGGNPNLSLMDFQYDELPNGKWTISFTSDSDFTITAPNGYSTNMSIPSEVVPFVTGNGAGDTALTPYFGIMPRTPENVGVACTFSRIQISGVPYPVDGTFSGEALDANKWSKLADDPAGIFVAGDDIFQVITWNVPNDQGFTSLIAAADPAGPWKEIGQPNSKWMLVGNTRQALVSRAALHAALGGSETNAAYYRLIKREFTKLQILLPGETAAPGTPTGKTGTPDSQMQYNIVPVTVNAVDNDWNVMTGVSDLVRFSSSDPLATLPSFDVPLENGTAVITDAVFFGTVGSFTLTVEDVTDPTKGSDTSPEVTVTPFQ